MTIDIAALPQPEHLTLLFKHGRSTTLLSILPSQEFSVAAHMLLAALESRNLTTLPGTDAPLPTSASDLELAVLVDRRDVTKGWVLVDDASTVARTGKKKSTTSKTADPATTWGDLGLKDGDWIAYRLKKQPSEMDADAEDDESTPDLAALDDPGWNVVLPTYDDEMDAEMESPQPAHP